MFFILTFQRKYVLPGRKFASPIKGNKNKTFLAQRPLRHYSFYHLPFQKWRLSLWMMFLLSCNFFPADKIFVNEEARLEVTLEILREGGTEDKSLVVGGQKSWADPTGDPPSCPPQSCHAHHHSSLKASGRLDVRRQPQFHYRQKLPARPPAENDLGLKSLRLNLLEICLRFVALLQHNVGNAGHA